MDPMREIPAVRQIPGEPRRRWFKSDSMDLILWFTESGGFFGFQLTYDIPLAERVLTWTTDGGYMHTGVDDGEGKYLGFKAAPVLIADGVFDCARVLNLFRSAGGEMPLEIALLVEEKIAGYPGRPSKHQ